MPKGPKAPRGRTYVAVTIGGQNRKLRYCGATLKRAAHHGVSMSALGPLFDDKGKERSRTEAENIDYNFLILWMGLLAFEPDATQDGVEFDIGIREIEPAFAAALKAFDRYAPGVLSKVDGGDEAKATTKNGEATTATKKKPRAAAA